VQFSSRKQVRIWIDVYLDPKRTITGSCTKSRNLKNTWHAMGEDRQHLEQEERIPENCGTDSP
jgi:hypothetical protein